MPSATAHTATVPLNSLRPLWLAMPFVPWLASFVPWFAPPFTKTWFMLAIYFMPANSLAIAHGARDLGTFREAFLFPYCLVLGLGIETMMRIVGKRAGSWRRVRRRTASLVLVVAAGASIGIMGLRYLQWIDWPTRPAPFDHGLFALRTHADRISEMTVYQMPGGLLDHNYAARLRAAPDLLPTLIESLDLKPVPEDRVADEFWTAPGAYWWRPPTSGLFYGTEHFSVTERGPDGDHYLVMTARDDDVLWVWLKSNF